MKFVANMLTERSQLTEKLNHLIDFNELFCKVKLNTFLFLDCADGLLNNMTTVMNINTANDY